MHKNMQAGFSSIVSLSTTSTSLVGASGSRHGLIICPPSSGTATLITDSSVVINQGFQISAGDPPLVLCKCSYGNLIEKPWYVISNEGQGPIGRSASEYWSKQDRTIAGAATATKTGVSGFRHVCTSITANYYEEETSGRILTLYNGSSNLWRTYTRGIDPVVWNDPVGVACDDGEDCTLTLVSAGAGTEAMISFSGFTIPTPTITFYELSENHGGNPARKEGDGEAY